VSAPEHNIKFVVIIALNCTLNRINHSSDTKIILLNFGYFCNKIQILYVLQI